MKICQAPIWALLLLWQFPQSILLGVLVLFNWKKIDWAASYWRDPCCFVFVGDDLLIPKVRDGISLGMGIIVDRRGQKEKPGELLSPETQQVIKHEYGHVPQSRGSGPLYLFSFGILSILGATVWWIFRLPSILYYRVLPWERLADYLGGVDR